MRSRLDVTVALAVIGSPSPDFSGHDGLWSMTIMCPRRGKLWDITLPDTDHIERSLRFLMFGDG